MDKQTGKLVARIAENLPDMDGRMMQRWIDDPKGLQAFLFGLNPPPVSALFPAPVLAKVYLRHVTTVALGATDESALTEEQIRRVFAGYVDSRLLAWKSKATGKTSAAVEKLIENGKFPEFFGNTAAELEKRRWQWGQVVKFCDVHPKRLRGGGYATFFLITVDGEPVAEDLSNVFVVCVRVDGRGQLYAYLDSFSYDDVWFAECKHHVILPQVA